jgi:hypothetical protein
MIMINELERMSKEAESKKKKGSKVVPVLN